MEMKKYWLFLDDERMPLDAFSYMGKLIYIDNDDWKIVRNYQEFVDHITKHGLPELVSFDHDLADVHYGYLHGEIPYDQFTEKTGWHCAKWLVEYCIDNAQTLPEFIVHSMNPTGADNIRGLLNNFKKFQTQNP